MHTVFVFACISARLRVGADHHSKGKYTFAFTLWLFVNESVFLYRPLCSQSQALCGRRLSPACLTWSVLRAYFLLHDSFSLILISTAPVWNLISGDLWWTDNSFQAFELGSAPSIDLGLELWHKGLAILFCCRCRWSKHSEIGSSENKMMSEWFHDNKNDNAKLVSSVETLMASKM